MRLIERRKIKYYQLKDLQHKLSRIIVVNTKANTLIIGDLKVKKGLIYATKREEKAFSETHQLSIKVIFPIFRIVSS